MDYAPLGNTGVQVSRLAFGTMSFGAEADEATSARLFARCRESGINFMDCADVYANGISERILGELIAPCRDEIVLATKAYFPSGQDVNARGSSRFHLVRAVEASLRRLNTDRIDVFFLHRFDDGTPLEETLRAVELLVQQGKVLYPAASNFAAWQVSKGLGLQAMHAWSPFAAIQPMYNLVKRQAEVELLPMAAAEGLGVFPYSPLGGGLLTGKYGVRRRPDGGRLVDKQMYAIRYGDPRVFEVAEAFGTLAKECGVHPVTLAVSWVASHPAVTAPLLGARNEAQLEPALAAATFSMDDDLRERISALYPAPAPATDRNEEGGAHDYANVVRR